MKFVLPAYQWFGIINKKKRGFKTFCRMWILFSPLLFLWQIISTRDVRKTHRKTPVPEPFFNPVSPVILSKIDIKSNPTLNGYNAKTRTNLKSKLKSSESSLSIIFCVLYPRRCTAGGSAPYNPRRCCQRLTGLKELIKLQPEACNFI